MQHSASSKSTSISSSLLQLYCECQCKFANETTFIVRCDVFFKSGARKGQRRAEERLLPLSVGVTCPCFAVKFDWNRCRVVRRRLNRPQRKQEAWIKRVTLATSTREMVGGLTGRESKPFTRRIFMNRETLKTGPSRVRLSMAAVATPRLPYLPRGRKCSFWRFARGHVRSQARAKRLPSFPKYTAPTVHAPSRIQTFQGRTNIHMCFTRSSFVRTSSLLGESFAKLWDHARGELASVVRKFLCYSVLVVSACLLLWQQGTRLARNKLVSTSFVFVWFIYFLLEIIKCVYKCTC